MLSKLTLGTAQFGLGYGINNHTGKPDINKSIEMLECAYLNGINSIDTAVAYGDSETVIGKWIKSYMHDFHDVMEYGEIISKTLRKLKEEGIVRNIGCSIYDLESIDTFLKYDFNTIQIPGSIFNQSIIESDKITMLKEKDIKVFVRSVFVQGLVFMNPIELPLYLSGIKNYIVELNDLSNRYKMTITEIAINYLFNHKNVDSIVFGVDSLNQLHEIIAIDKNHRIDKEIIVNEFSKIPKELVDPRNWRILNE